MKPERAEWRPNPVTERAIAEDRRLERRRRRHLVLLAATGVGLCPLSCLGTCATFESANSGFFFPLGLFSAALFVYGVIRYGLDKESGRDRRIAWRGEFSGVTGWMVEMTIHQGEVVSGRDLGIVWFAEDRLYFNGTRTSFGLLTGDTLGRAFDGDAVLESGTNLVIPLRERTPVGSVAIGLRFFAPEPELSSAISEATFRKALRGWFALGGDVQGQGPPLAMGPESPSLDSLAMRARLGTMVWPALGILTILVGLWSGPSAAIAFGIVALLTLLWAPARSPRRCWRAVRDRRALEAYNESQ